MIESFLLHSDIIITFTIWGGGPVLLLELLEFFFHYIELNTASQKIPLFHPTKKINATLAFLFQCVNCATNCLNHVMTTAKPGLSNPLLVQLIC